MKRSRQDAAMDLKPGTEEDIVARGVPLSVSKQMLTSRGPLFSTTFKIQPLRGKIRGRLHHEELLWFRRTCKDILENHRGPLRVDHVMARLMQKPDVVPFLNAALTTAKSTPSGQQSINEFAKQHINGIRLIVFWLLENGDLFHVSKTPSMEWDSALVSLVASFPFSNPFTTPPLALQHFQPLEESVVDFENQPRHYVQHAALEEAVQQHDLETSFRNLRQIYETTLLKQRQLAKGTFSWYLQDGAISEKLDTVASLLQTLLPSLELERAKSTYVLSMLLRDGLTKLEEKDARIRELEEQLAQQEPAAAPREDDLVKQLQHRIAELESRPTAPMSPRRRPPRMRKKQTEPIQPMTLGSPEAVVESIRRSRGIGILETTSTEVQSCMKGLYRSLDAAVQRLAEDIYSSSSRFLLELIQNADDNTYDKNVMPHLHIVYNATKQNIWTANNEGGFSAENVKALSDIGGSTKSKNTIGYKGIGFKSVFSVCDTPTIISNGYYFRFNATKRLGYMTPEWIDQQQLDTLCTDVSLHTIKPHNTYIILPLKPGQQNIGDVYDEIDHIPLFLRQLKSIRFDWMEKSTCFEKSISVKTHHETIQLSVQVKENGRQTSTMDRNYKVFSKILDLPQHIAPDRFRSKMDVTAPIQTELVLAFPIDSDLEPVPLFSYLPIRSVGFRFLVQGEFELTASRQDVHKNNPWNAALRDAIASFFFECISQMLRSSSKDHMADLVSTFIPLPSDISDPFWNVVATRCCELASQIPCILCESGAIRCLNEVLLRPAHLSPELVSSNDMFKGIQKEFVHPSLDLDRLTKRLHLVEATEVDVINVCNALHNDISEKEDAWRSLFYEYMGQCIASPENDVSLDSIATSQHVVRSLLELPLFLTQSSDAPLSLLESRLYLTLPPQLLHYKDRLGASLPILNVEKPSKHELRFFRALGIKTPSLEQVLSDIMTLHALRSPCLSVTIVEAHLCIFKEYLATIEASPILCTQFRSVLVPTQADTLVPALKSYLPIPQTQWAESLGPLSFPYVHTSEALTPDWVAFFVLLGCHSGLIVDSPEMIKASEACTDTKSSHLIPFILMVHSNWTSGETYAQTPLMRTYLNCMRAPNTMNAAVCFHNSPFSTELHLPDTFPFLHAEAQHVHHDILHQLGVHTMLNEESAIDLMEHAKSAGMSRISDWIALYRCLRDAKLGFLVKEVFVEAGEHDIIKGKVPKLAWNFPPLVGRWINQKPLKSIYPTDLFDFFVYQVGVSINLEMNVLRKAVNHFETDRQGRLEQFTEAELYELVSSLYSEINRRLPEEKEAISGGRLSLLTADSGFVKCDAFINDNPQLFDLFGGHISVVNETLLQYPQLLEACGVQRLSEAVKRDLSRRSANSAKWSELHSITKSVRHLLRQAVALYTPMLSASELTQLRTLGSTITVFQTSFLEVQYELSSATLKNLRFYVPKRLVVLPERNKVFLHESMANNSDLVHAIVRKLAPSTLSQSHIDVLSVHRFAPEISETRMTTTSSGPDPAPILSLASKASQSTAMASDLVAMRSRIDQLGESLLSSRESMLEAAQNLSRAPTRAMHVGSGGSVPPEDAREHVGAVGEYFAFLQIKSWVSEYNAKHGKHVQFDRYNWVSELRLQFFPNDARNINNAAGFDFFLNDPGGLLSSHPGAVTWLIEVKSHSGKQTHQFHISSNEWARAKKTSDASTDQRFLIIGVALQPDPHIAYWLDDPVALHRSRCLTLLPDAYVATQFPTL